METLRQFASLVNERQILLVGLLAALCVATERFTAIALIGVLLCAALHWVLCGRPVVATTVDLPVLLLLAMAGVALLVTVLPDTTYPQIFRLVVSIGLFYAIIGWATNESRLRIALVVLGSSGVALSLMAFFTVRWYLIGGKLPFVPVDIYPQLNAIANDSINPNVMAGYLALVVSFLVAVVLFGWGQLARWLRALILFAIGLPLGVIVLTQSRGGLLALALSLLALLALRWRWGWLLALALLGVAGLAVANIGAGVFTDSLTGGGISGSVVDRMEVWSRGIYMVQDFFFTGSGMGSFNHVVREFYPFMIAAPDVPHAHNLFLQVAIDLGVPGLIAWLTILFLIIAAAWQVYRQGLATNNHLWAGYGAGFLASLVVLVAHGMLDAVTWGMVRPAVLVWGLWGIIVAAWHVQLNQRQAQP
jgi:putative inorganic carbon (HCO3(-)) transporter